MPTVVQAKHGQTGTGTSVSVTLNAAPFSGNLLIASIAVGGSAVGPTFPWSGTPDASTGAGPINYLMSKPAGASESATVTFSVTTARRMSIAVIEIAPDSGRTWGSLDKTATNAGTAVTSLAVGPTSTLADPDEISVVGIALSSTPGAGGSWSDSYTLVSDGLDLTTGGFTGYKVLTTTAATQSTGTWTTSRNAVGLLGTYRQVSLTPPGQNSAFLSLL